MAEHKFKFRHAFFAIIALALCISIISASSGQVLAESLEEQEYVSDLELFSAADEGRARAKAEERGFIPVPGNLNLGGSEAVVLGYRTTHDKNLAIYDISMAQMNSGYTMLNYGEIAKKQAEKLTGVGEELVTAIDEFADNYKKSSPAAVECLNILNSFAIDEMNNTLLGDYFASGNCDKDFALKVISRANSSVVTAVYNSLVAGTADFGGTSWAQRVATSGVQQQLEDEDFKELDILYKEYALELYPAIQLFTQKYDDASARAAVSDNEALMEADRKDIGNIPDETLEKITDGEILDESDGDALYITAYESLNRYDYDENMKLGDYLVAAGRKTFGTIVDLRYIYPLVAALTNGQAAIMRISGLAPMALYLDNTEELLERAKETLADIKQKIKKVSNDPFLSIWIGTDQKIYLRQVALTDELERYSQAGANYVDLTKDSAFDSFLSEALSIISFASVVISIAFCITTLAAKVIGSMAVFTIWVGTATAWTVCCAAVGTGVLGSILGVLGCAAIILNWVALAAMAVILITFLVKWIIDLCKDDDDDVTYSEMPNDIFDLNGSNCIKYQLVKNQSNVFDLNANEGKRWNGLYCSFDKNAGKPITVDTLENAFHVQYGTNTCPDGYTPVKTFGEVTAANLNANHKEKSAGPIYLFYHTEGSAVVENEGTDVSTEDSVYLLKLLLSCEKTETAAKSALTKKGYLVLDVNLTPNAYRKYTYLGYKTTTNPEKAITDIRISPKNSSSPFFYGDSSYTCCGSTATNDGLYYTTYANAGSPILADIQAVDTIAKAEKGFEPVNFFCGGNAFNFNCGDDDDNFALSYKHFRSAGRYLFFHPSVMYTEGTEYVSGLVMVTGTRMDDNKHYVKDYIKELDLIPYDINLTETIDIEKDYDVLEGKLALASIDNLETFLCYTTTYNPYRAITDVKSYIGSPTNDNLNANLGSNTTGGFSACAIMYQLPDEPQVDSNDMDDCYRGIYSSNSFILPGKGAPDVCSDYHDGEMAHDDFENYEWDNSGFRPKGIYVCGHMEGKTPLTPDDIIASREPLELDGYVSVQDFRTPNRTEPNNLAYDKIGAKNHKLMYLYIKKDVHEGKYIAAVNVVSYDLKNMMGSDTYNSLDDDQIEDIDKTADDIVISSLLTSCTDEIININIAKAGKDTFQHDYERWSKNVSYIGVSRTDDPTQAIHGLLKYEPKDGKAPAQITVGGVKYTRCGDKINDNYRPYWIYAAVSDGAIPGEPITSIVPDTTPIISEAATVLSIDSQDTAEEEKAPYGNTHNRYYIHTSFEDMGTYISSVYIGVGETKAEALLDLLAQRCCIAIDINLNADAGGSYVYMGYTKYSPKKTDKNQKYAVRDIIFTKGQPYQNEIEYNGIKYVPALTRSNTGVSLNEGTFGEDIYMYYTTYFSSGNNKAVLDYSPIMRLGFAQRDRIPDSKDTFNWENVFCTEGTKINLNAGAVVFDFYGRITDNRIYMFVNRLDNSPLVERKITGGHCDESVDYGILKIKGAGK